MKVYNKFILVLIYTIIFIILSIYNKFYCKYDFTNLFIISFIFLVCIILISKSFLNMENFIVCNEGNHVMEPTNSEDYIDPSIINSKLTEISYSGCRYPFNPNYIPNKKKKWCLKAVLDK